MSVRLSSLLAHLDLQRVDDGTVDLDGVGTSMSARAGQDPMVQKAGLKWMADMYIAGKDTKSPLAAPLHADLKGLPPVLVQVGTAETLLDDATRIAAAYRQAYGRDARSAEVEKVLAYLKKSESAADAKLSAEAKRLQAWRGFCRVLFASNEFLFVE